MVVFADVEPWLQYQSSDLSPSKLQLHVPYHLQLLACQSFILLYGIRIADRCTNLGGTPCKWIVIIIILDSPEGYFASCDKLLM